MQKKQIVCLVVWGSTQNVRSRNVKVVPQSRRGEGERQRIRMALNESPQQKVAKRRMKGKRQLKSARGGGEMQPLPRFFFLGGGVRSSERDKEKKSARPCLRWVALLT